MNLREMPKVELHRHLELSLRHETMKELAPACGIDVPDQAAFADRFLITEPMTNLGAVLNKFLDTQVLLNSTEVLERISYEACLDAYLQEGIRILELRYAPTYVRQGHEHISFQQIHEAIVKGCKQAQQEVPLAVGLICIIQRILPVPEAEAITQFAIDNRETFIGLDLADNEEGFDSKPFSPFFHRAAEAGLGITIHSGEANVPKAPRYVKDAIEYLGATRIGHGVQIYRDHEMMDYVKERNVTLELCPTSNWLTQAIPRVEEHPFRLLMEAGVRTTINSDDPGIFNIDLVNEYDILSRHHGFTEDEFTHCNDIAAEASFIPLGDKQKAWPRPIG
ncbi:MAG: adenosine deaminase [Bdellovibrionaceae bacterium]|nr:adenosine deaminase [Bdellovibrionales bacterium]MCB9084914.1 adenosine deaminase [Pseudobdellovibrionaceae bacterium]